MIRHILWLAYPRQGRAPQALWGFRRISYSRQRPRRVLVPQGGVPVPVAHEISLRRYWGGWFGFSKKVEEVDNAPLQTVTGTPGTACGAFQFHREYGGVSNPKQLTPGVYKLKVEIKI